MKEKETEDAGTAYPNPGQSGPGRPGKSKQQENEDEDDPLFEEEELDENFEEDEDEDDVYEINDSVKDENLADIYDYMCSSL